MHFECTATSIQHVKSGKLQPYLQWPVLAVPFDLLLLLPWRWLGAMCMCNRIEESEEYFVRDQCVIEADADNTCAFGFVSTDISLLQSSDIHGDVRDSTASAYTTQTFRYVYTVMHTHIWSYLLPSKLPLSEFAMLQQALHVVLSTAGPGDPA